MLGDCVVELLFSDLRIPLQQPHREFVDPLLLIVPQLLLLLLLPQVDGPTDLGPRPELLADAVQVADEIAVFLDVEAEFLHQSDGLLMILLLSHGSRLLLLPELIQGSGQLLSLQCFETHGLLVVQQLLRLLFLLQIVELLEFRVLLLLNQMVRAAVRILCSHLLPKLA